MQSKPCTPHRARWRLLASLAITVILFGMAVPYLGDYMANTRLREAGNALHAETQAIVASLESESVTHLSDDERLTLIRLLRKVYQPQR